MRGCPLSHRPSVNFFFLSFSWIVIQWPLDRDVLKCVGFPNPPHTRLGNTRKCGSVPLTPTGAHSAKRRAATQLKSRMKRAVKLLTPVILDITLKTVLSQLQEPSEQKAPGMMFGWIWPYWMTVLIWRYWMNYICCFCMKMLGQVLWTIVAEGGAWAAYDTAEEAWPV